MAFLKTLCVFALMLGLNFVIPALPTKDVYVDILSKLYNRASLMCSNYETNLEQRLTTYASELLANSSANFKKTESKLHTIKLSKGTLDHIRYDRGSPVELLQPGSLKCNPNYILWNFEVKIDRFQGRGNLAFKSYSGTLTIEGPIKRLLIEIGQSIRDPFAQVLTFKFDNRLQQFKVYISPPDEAGILDTQVLHFMSRIMVVTLESQMAMEFAQTVNDLQINIIKDFST